MVIVRGYRAERENRKRNTEMAQDIEYLKNNVLTEEERIAIEKSKIFGGLDDY